MTDKPAAKTSPRIAVKAKKSGAATATVHQFKITLDHSKPSIWRHIQLASDASFWDLHCAVNDAMGWEDAHLHAFQIGSPPHTVDIGIPDEDAMPWGEVATLAGWEVPIDSHFKQPGDRCTYLYDFGDDWSHEVMLEEILPRAAGGKYPRCLAGARACPPEDCGGIYGYTQLCKALTKPGKADENIEELLEWLGPDFDPQAFDAGDVKFYSAKRRLKALLSAR